MIGLPPMCYVLCVVCRMLRVVARYPTLPDTLNSAGDCGHAPALDSLSLSLSATLPSWLVTWSRSFSTILSYLLSAS